MCQLRRARLLTVTFVLGKVTTMWRVSILLTAVNTNSCFYSCRWGDGRKDRSWHKLNWWHVRLVFRNLKRTGPDPFWLCVSELVYVCVYGGMVVSLIFRMDAGQCVFLWWERRHQLFQMPEVSEEISQLLEHSNAGALHTRWKIKRFPGRCWDTSWSLLPLICIAFQTGVRHYI